MFRHRNAYSSSPGHGGSYNSRGGRSAMMQGGPQWAEGQGQSAFDSASGSSKGYPQHMYGGSAPAKGEYDGAPPYGGGGPYWQGGTGRRRPSGDGIKGARRGGHGSSGLQMEIQPGSYGSSPGYGPKLSMGSVTPYGSAPKDGSSGARGGHRGYAYQQQPQPPQPGGSGSSNSAFPPPPPPQGAEGQPPGYAYSPSER